MPNNSLPKQLKYRFRGPLLKLLLRLLALLPLRVNHFCGALLGSLLYRFDKKFKHVTLTNLRLCFPDKTEQQIEQLGRDSVKESAKAMTEIGPLWFWSQQRVLKLVKKVTGEELLTQAMADGKGAIIAAPHIGCWEIIGPYCSVKHPFTIMYRPATISEINQVMVNSRTRTGATLVPTDASGVRGLFTALKKGELIGILPDQDPDKENGTFAPFFGVPTNTMQLLPKLASKTKAAVIFTYAERLPRGQGFHIHFTASPDGIHERRMEVSTAALNKGVEQCVVALPEQYVWSYKRFKTRPEGEKKVY